MHLAAMRLIQVLLAVAVSVAGAQAVEPSLTAGPWSIVELGGKRVGTPATMSFTRVRWLGVRTPCGSLWGWYRRSGAALRIHIAGRSRWQIGSGSPCQRLDYHLLLGRVRSLAFEGDRLLLRGDDGKAVARLLRKQ